VNERKNIEVVKQDIKGEPKWDWLFFVNIPIDFQKWSLDKVKVGKGFLKRMLKKIHIEL
jgi:hypothetical protein